MLRGTILTTVLTLGVIGAAAAQDTGIKVIGQGENFAVEYSNDGGNILGGGPVQVIGRGESIRYLHAADAPAQHGPVAITQGQGEDGHIVYGPAPRG